MHGHTDPVDIEIREGEGHCLISVADRGKGIPDEIKARIFDEGFKFGEYWQHRIRPLYSEEDDGEVRRARSPSGTITLGARSSS